MIPISIIEWLKNDVNTQAPQYQLYLALSFLLVTLTLLVILYVRFIRRTRKGYGLLQTPFKYYFSIYTGIILIVINELIILISIIYSDQQYTLLGREKAILIIGGYGLFLYGWTNIVFFNIKIPNKLERLLRIVFLAAFSFYIFALLITVLITFRVVHTGLFIGLGYELAVGIYVPFLLIDLLSLAVIANRKRLISKFQAWLGLILFLSLLLQILMIVFNALPLILVDRVAHETHEFFNYIVEPFAYMVTAPLTLLFLYWVIFNPEWMERRFIEKDT